MLGRTDLSVAQRLRSSYLRLRMRLCAPLAAIALSSAQRDLIRADMATWDGYGAIPHGPGSMSELDLMASLIAANPPFRNLLYYRFSRSPSASLELLLPLLRRIWRPQGTLRFCPDSLGPGCFIVHGWETVVVARSIGSDFVVGQHVVIGYTAANKYPTIGDHVSVSVGAIVIGDIRIGDHVMVGAGAVVVRDVPDGVTVVGVPARPVD